MRTIVLTILFTVMAFLKPVFVSAKIGVDLAITPPLIELNMLPGEEMKTAVKVVNNSDKEIIVNAEVRDFKNDENNKIKFFKKDDVDAEEDKSILSQWITFRSEVMRIPPFQSVNVAFTIQVPETAGPGGHYAAILVGNSPEGRQEGTNVVISSYLSSLILLNIDGDIVETGEIRSFSTDKMFYSEHRVKFNLLFKNRGNVHLHPEGDIKIYDFWNNDVGNIPINKGTSFGNVLPDSTKNWEFEWSQKKDIFKMGKYKAKLALVYGEQSKQSDFREIDFWIIDFKVVSYVFGSILLVVLLLISLVKFSIKRSVDRVKMEVDEYNHKYKKESFQPKLIDDKNGKKMLDLRKKK